MRWTRPAITAALLGIAASTALAKSQAPADAPIDYAAPQTDVDVLAMEEEHNNRVTVPVSIGDHGPFRFMVDTGAQATVLSSALADQLGLTDRQPATLVAMASRTQVETVSVEGFQLGSRNFSLINAPLLEPSNFGRADGILGVDSLQGLRVLLDFRDNSIHVADAKELGGNLGYEIVVRARERLGQLIITDAYLGKTKVAVVIDTGAQDSIGNPALRKKLLRADGGATKLTDVAGVTVGTEYRVAPSLQIGKAMLAKVPIAFANSPAFRELGLNDRPAMVLGMRQLRLFKRVAIDFRKKRVYFDLPREKFYQRGQTLRRNRVAS